MHAETLGKYKFILQAFAIVALLVHYRYWGLDFFAVGMYFLALSAVVAIWSGINYHVQFFRLRHCLTAPLSAAEIDKAYGFMYKNFPCGCSSVG